MFFSLSFGDYYSYFKLEGKDSLDFMHRISTVHMHSLQEKNGALGFFLSPLGKIQSFFAVFKNNSESFYFIVFDDSPEFLWKNYFQNTLEHFHFSEDFLLKEISQNDFLSVSWNVKNPIEFNDLHRDSEKYLHSEMQRIQTLTPKLGKEIFYNKTNPLEVGLFFAISRTKGCYPGQEVIEKIQAKGAPAYRLCLCEVMDKAQNTLFQNSSESIEIYSKKNNKKCGQITSFIKNEKYFLALLSKTDAERGVLLEAPSWFEQAHVIQVSLYQSE